jgi:hypothetical protein
MPVAYIQEFDVDPGGDRSTANYDAVSQRLNAEADPPDGIIVHTAGFDEDAKVFRIFDVWESQEHARRFLDDRLAPILKELVGDAPPGPAPRETFYELHDVMGA